MVKKIAILVVLILAAFCAYKYFAKSDETKLVYKTAKIEKRDIVISIDATGPVEPEDLVDVAARVSGEIVQFGKDVDGNAINFGSKVKAGEMLAVIDDQIQRSDLLTANARLASANASLAQAKANLAIANASFKKAKRDWDRAEKVGIGRALSQAEYDSYLSEYERAQAQIEASNASILMAESEIEQAQATVTTAKRNLEYCTIKAPVDGVVVDRKVNIGQTVVSNMSASSLFSIAKDLKHMEIWASVNEADIGLVKVGQRVEFTVDAFPSEIFEGKVSRVRLNATMSQNVVVFMVEISVDNSDGKLLPYLTANTKFEIEKAKNVLNVPNTALRWAPDFAREEKYNGHNVWVLQKDGSLKEVKLEIGISDGVYTEVKSGDLKNGDVVVVGMQDVQVAGKATSSNPFLPKPPMRGKKPNNTSSPKK